MVVVSIATTSFLNIDLDLFDVEPLEEFAAAWGDDVVVLHHGEWTRGWQLSVEVSAMVVTAEATARELVRLIDSLPDELRARWDRLQDRVLDLGVSAGLGPQRWSTSLPPSLLQAIGALELRLVVTVYAPARE